MAQEKSYENKIKRLLDSQGAYHVKFFGCGFTQAGVPDLLCCVNGRFVGIEVKADAGRPSALQIHNIKRIRECGGIALIAYPRDFDALKSLIESIVKNEAIEKHYAYFLSQSFD